MAFAWVNCGINECPGGSQSSDANRNKNDWCTADTNNKV